MRGKYFKNDQEEQKEGSEVEDKIEKSLKLKTMNKDDVNLDSGQIFR